MFPIKQRKEALATLKDVPARTPPRPGPTSTPAAMATLPLRANGRGHCSFRSVCVPAPLRHNDFHWTYSGFHLGEVRFVSVAGRDSILPPPTPFKDTGGELIWGQFPSQAWSDLERWTGILSRIDFC